MMKGRAVSLLALAALAATSSVSGSGSTSQSQAHLAPSSGSSPERYDGHQVWRLDWRDLDLRVKDEILEAVELLNLDVWRSSPSNLDVRLHPADLPSFHRFLTQDILLSNFIPDLQHLIDLSTPASTSFLNNTWDLRTLDTPYHDAYHSLEEIHAFGQAMVDQFPGIVEGFEVGTSFEGSEIRGWRAHLASNESGTNVRDSMQGRGKKVGKGKAVESGVKEIVIQSGQHAREWIGPSTALYFLHALLVEVKNDPAGEIAKLLRTFTFTIVPTINPDGFAYSHKHSRMWRKNRQEVGSQLCSGIDLNSNWGYKWRPGRSTTACSDSYPGKGAFEAYETRAMANYLANGTTWHPNVTGITDDGSFSEGRRVRAFVDLHSYGQLFMFPFAHSCDDFPPDAEMLMEAGLGVAKAMRTHRGEAYQAGQACELTYRAPGDAIDYSYGVTDIPWSYSAELRDTGTYGFLLPPNLIRPTADEVTAGLLYLAKFIYTIEIAG